MLEQSNYPECDWYTGIYGLHKLQRRSFVSASYIRMARKALCVRISSVLGHQPFMLT